jgi:hypothetical protein
MIRLEPIPRQIVPKKLREMHDLVVQELYSYSVVSRGAARVFCEEYEERLRSKLKSPGAKFHLHNIVLFMAKTAGTGVISNLAYAALVRLVAAVRKPKQEFPPNKYRFEAVISRTTYNRLRRERHPETKASRLVSDGLETKLQTDYRLMVMLTKDSATPRKSAKKK